MILWFIGDAFWLHRVAQVTKPQFEPTPYKSAMFYNSGSHLKAIANEIRSILGTAEATITIPTDPASKLDSERMPLELLPSRAMSVNKNLDQIPPLWEGYILLLGRAEASLTDFEAELTKHMNRAPKIELDLPTARLLKYDLD
tara:strand:- start:627 stop:1055 length:429 start_codon:yes stop_codon:yes gene_type:complete